jgi:hypothetical protein
MITVIPIVGIVVAGVVVLFAIRWNHRERMAQIERGIQPNQLIDLPSFLLLSGLLATAVGVALTLVQILVSEGGYGLLGGLIPLAVGIGLLIHHRIESTKRKE